MSLTNFPNGVTSFGVPVIPGGGVASVPFSTGKYFFVDSTNPGGKGTKRHPFETIDEAVAYCQANRGDVIIVCPGHTETITAAGGLDLDVAGITVVGVGTGSLQPKVVLDAAAADVDVDAANVTIRNLHFVASFADVAVCLDVNAGDCWIDQCRFSDEGSNLNFVDYIHVGADGVADGLKVTDCVAISPDTGNDGFINAAGDIDRLVFQRNFVKLGVAANEPVIEVAGKSLFNCLITHNFIFRDQTAGDIFIASDQADNSGIVAYNVIGALDGESAVPIDLTGAHCFENYYTGEADLSGFLLPVAADDAADT